jgi:Iron-containing redox enzyme
MAHSLPQPIGVNSFRALDVLRGQPATPLVFGDDAFDRDTQLAWFMLNATSFAGWHDVSDEVEWDPSVVAMRRSCEDWFTNTVVSQFDDADDPTVVVRDILSASGPSMSGYLAEAGTPTQVAESLMLRLPYQFNEADPHTFAIPRIEGTVKRALVEIQTGEYGVGHRSTHAELFRHALGSLGVDGYTSVIDRLPGVAFATANLVSMGGLNRSKRGVVIGQLALFEMDSVKPNGAMVVACERLGLPAGTRRFFEVHVMADAEHELIAADAFLRDYPVEDPEQLDNLVFGIKAQHVIDLALAEHAIGSWSVGRSALLSPAAAMSAA